MWRCSADSNAELVANLEAGGIVKTPAVRDALLATDRGHFVPDRSPTKKQAKKNSTYVRRDATRRCWTLRHDPCAIMDTTITSVAATVAATATAARRQCHHQPPPPPPPTRYNYGKYADAPQAIGFKVTISAPHIHATALEALAEKVVGVEGGRVLDVGCGSGVLVACLARMAEASGTVVGVEVVAGLVPVSIENLRNSGLRPNLRPTSSADVTVTSDADTNSTAADANNATAATNVTADTDNASAADATAVPMDTDGAAESHIAAPLADGHTSEGPRLIVRHGDGWQGCEEYGPFDAIHVGASTATVPEALVAQVSGRHFTGRGASFY